MADREAEMRRSLQVENQTLRELLDISKTQWKRKPKQASEPGSPVSDPFDQTSFFIDNVGSRSQLFSDSGSDTSVESVRFVVATPLSDGDTEFVNSSDRGREFVNSSDSGIVDCDNKIITNVTLLDKDYKEEQHFEPGPEYKDSDNYSDNYFLQVKEEAIDCSTPTPDQFLDEPQYPVSIASEDDNTIIDGPVNVASPLAEVEDDVQLDHDVPNLDNYYSSDTDYKTPVEKSSKVSDEVDTKRADNIENTVAVKNLTSIFIDYCRDQPCSKVTVNDHQTAIPAADQQASTPAADHEQSIPAAHPSSAASEEEDLDTLEFDDEDIESALSGFDSILDEEDNGDDDIESALSGFDSILDEEDNDLDDDLD